MELRTAIRRAPGFVVERARRALVRRRLAWFFSRRSDHRALDTARATALLRDADAVLFCCWGNVCRSPFAAHRFRALLDATGVEDVTVRSVGLGSRDGRPSPPEAVAAAESYGVDLSGHRSLLADEELVTGSDVVFVMDYNNYHSVTRRYPDVADRTFFLGALAPGDDVIDDPYGADVESFERTYDRIASAVAVAAANVTGRAASTRE